jgi:hypothetical protein
VNEAVTDVFAPRTLPADVATDLRLLLAGAHSTTPFSSADVRATVNRVRLLLADLPVRATVYRGGLDLAGVEVDHVWLALSGEPPWPGPGVVLDAAFPLLDDDFVGVLRCFVAGDADPEALDAAAARTDVTARVVGVFPARMRYLGRPVWSSRS